MSESPYRPWQVDDLADRVEQHVGVRPVVIEINSRQWEVRLAGEHVTAIGGYKLRPMDGRVKFIPGDLIIDGQQRPRSSDLGHLRDIWKRYELGEKTEIPELADWTGSMDDVPKAPRKLYEELLGVEVKEDGTPLLKARLGFDAENEIWFAGADTVKEDEGPGCVWFAYIQPDDAHSNAWMIAPTLSVFIKDGMRNRITSAAQMRKLLMEMVNAQRARPASSSTGPVQRGSTATPGKANSVATRRASVIRV